jgi:hypothetical protein
MSSPAAALWLLRLVGVTGALARIPIADLGFDGEAAGDDMDLRRSRGTGFNAPFLWVCGRVDLGTDLDLSVACRVYGACASSRA